MSKTTTRDPDKTEVVLVNATARVPRELRSDARIIALKRGHTIQQILTTALQQYVEANRHLLSNAAK